MPAPPLAPPPLRRSPSGSPTSAPRREFEAPQRWRWILLGTAIAWLGGSLLPGMFVWVLCALPHEMGHATIGCLLGRPSAPAIGLSGDAWTGIAERENWLVIAIALALAATAVVSWRRRVRALAVIAAIATALVPMLAYAAAGEVLIAAGGHLGELSFASYCYALAWTGGRTGSVQERTACAFAGGLLQAANVRLCLGLMTSAAARGDYASNGSLGMKNDYLVLAEDLLDCRLQSVAATMLLLALLLPPLGLAIAALLRDDEAADG